MADTYQKFAAALDAPARQGFGVTTSDGADLSTATRALYVGGAGTLKLELVGDSSGNFITLVDVPGGSFLPLRVRKIWATGTTATSIVALY